MLAGLQVCLSDFRPRRVYKLKESQVQQFTLGIHRSKGCVLNIKLSNSTVHYMYRQFNIQNLYALTTNFYMSCVDLRTNSHYFTTQHQLTDFYNKYLTF
jgi:hypothetical protein